jgi:hypothetical protein
MSPFRQATLFLLASLALQCLIFGDALWGRRLLAPVDIAPALWEKYAYVDPQSNGVPRNQHLVDQLGYDLPLQYLMHAAWRSGEIPWWNPYSYGGRPLLADAHCNGADPIRVATYLAVPDFVTAYNWTRALHSLWGALGIFLLLRGVGPGWLAGGLALAFQVAGWKVQLFGHPWVEGVLCWYPWLWLAWNKTWEGDRRWAVVGAGVCVAAIFLAGNLQSHAYLPLFALAVGWGWAGISGQAWWRAVKVLAPSLIAGGLLALPLLLAELELFHLKTRDVTASGPAFPLWNVPLALAGLHPWLLGTAKTGSLKVGEVPAFGFALWAGSVALPLAGFGLRKLVGMTPAKQNLRRTAIVLVVGWLVIIASPLNRTLYARYAGIPVMGLLVLAALGVERLRQGARPGRVATVALGIIALGAAVAGDVVGRMIYPRVKEKYAAMLSARMSTDGYGGRSARLRSAQVEAVPGELSLGNPEVALAVLALAGAAAVCLNPRWRLRGEVWAGLLLLNLGAPVLYSMRFFPAAPREQWERLLAGPPEQRDFFARVKAERARLEDYTVEHLDEKGRADGFAGWLPQEFSALQRVHVLHGYAALHPPNAWIPGLSSGVRPADYRLARDGTVTTQKFRRFEFTDADGVPPKIAEERLCYLEVSLQNGVAGQLLRRDSAYPGWIAPGADGSRLPLVSEGFASRVPVPLGNNRISFAYRPTFFAFGLAGSLGGMLILAAGIIFQRRAAKGLEESR